MCLLCSGSLPLGKAVLHRVFHARASGHLLDRQGALVVAQAGDQHLARHAALGAAEEHPPALLADRLPAHRVAAEAVHQATLDAAEVFGAMGVMRDMPLQKYVHDAHVFLFGIDHDSATKLEVFTAP